MAVPFVSSSWPTLKNIAICPRDTSTPEIEQTGSYALILANRRASRGIDLQFYATSSYIISLKKIYNAVKEEKRT